MTHSNPKYLPAGGELRGPTRAEVERINRARDEWALSRIRATAEDATIVKKPRTSVPVIPLPRDEK